MLQGFQYSDQAYRPAGTPARPPRGQGSRKFVKLQLFAFLLLVGVVGLAGWIFYESREARWDSAERTGRSLVTALDRDITRSLTFYDLALLAVRRRASVPEFANLSPEARQRLLFDGTDQLLKFGAIEILDRAGWVVAGSRSSMALPANGAQESYFQFLSTAASDNLNIDMQRQGPDGTWQLVLSRRMVDEAGNFSGIVRGSVDIAQFQEMFEAVDVGVGGIVTLVTRDTATVIAQAGMPARPGSRVIAGNFIPPGPSGAFVWKTPSDGVTRLFLFRRMANFPLDISIGISGDTIDGPWRDEARIVALGFFLLIVAGMALVLVVRREFRRRGAAEGEAADAAAKYRLVADHVTDIISKTSLDGTRTYVSPAYSRILGFDPAEIVGTKAVDFAFPDDVPRVAGALEICIAGMGHASCVYRARHRDGHWRWVEASHQAVHDEHGGMVEIVSAIRDITQQKQAAEELARKTGMLDAILANMPDGVCLFDAHQRFVAWNVQLWEILDLDRSAILATSNPTEAFMRTMVERGDYGRVDVEEFVRKRIASIAAGERLQQRRPTMSGKWVELRATPMPDGGSLSIYRDVDQEVRRELDLREAYEQVGRQASDLAAIAEQAEAAQIEAESARTAADEASRAKSDFLASMSHEIRTPMSGILGFSDLLLDTPLNGEQQRLVKMLRDAGKGLLTIINDILDVSKIEAGKLQLESIPVNIASVADGALSMVRPQADAKHLALGIDVDPGVPAWVLGDPTRLRQIILNLLSNAVKFTDRGSVRLSVRREAPQDEAPRDEVPRDEVPRDEVPRDEVMGQKTTAGDAFGLVVAVTDTGIGIDPGRQSLLFQNFQQVDASTTRKYGGTGLGLAISRNLVEAMGGTIGVVSEEGRGSTFHFRLDVCETEPPAEMLLAHVGRARENPARILVAEDLDMNQLIVQRMLEAAGHEVTIVSNGAEALEALRHSRFDLVLMDMEMPVMNGLVAAEAIRGSSASFRSVPIIALTANSMAGEIDRCRSAGMDGHLGKPIDRTMLLDTIERWMAKGSAPLERAPSESPEPTVPEEAAAPAPPVLDLDLLTGLERRLGVDQVAKFAEMFRQQLGKTMAAIVTARDTTAIATEAHILVSLAGNLGLNELMHAARALMNAARQQKPEMAMLAADLSKIAARASGAIDTRYPSLAAA